MIEMKNVHITDEFWQKEQELVRTEVIPYQWEALNDRVPGAAPSFAIHNLRAAKALRERSGKPGFTAPVFTEAPFEVLPEDPEHPDPVKFYGFVFQDTDVYKWIEAVAYSLDTYYILNGRNREFTNLRDHHELYCFGHLAEGAAAYYQATGNDELLRVAERFAGYISRKIGPEEGKKHGYPGHEIAEDLKSPKSCTPTTRRTSPCANRTRRRDTLCGRCTCTAGWRILPG